MVRVALYSCMHVGMGLIPSDMTGMVANGCGGPPSAQEAHVTQTGSCLHVSPQRACNVRSCHCLLRRCCHCILNRCTEFFAASLHDDDDEAATAACAVCGGLQGTSPRCCRGLSLPCGRTRRPWATTRWALWHLDCRGDRAALGYALSNLCRSGAFRPPSGGLG